MARGGGQKDRMSHIEQSQNVLSFRESLLADLLFPGFVLGGPQLHLLVEANGSRMIRDSVVRNRLRLFCPLL